MASGSGLATALAALKGHAVAVAVVGTLLVGGGAAAAAAVATGHVPGGATQQHNQNENGGTTARTAACANNGDAQRLAAIFAPMFDTKASAQDSICTLFVGSDGHARGFGEIQQALEITAAIEHNGGDAACLTATTTHGTPTAHGTPTSKGKPPTAGTPAAGQPTFTAPTATTSDTVKIVTKVLDAADHGTPLAKLAEQCGATHVTGGGDEGQSQGTPEAKPTGTPGEKPEGTPGAKPTGTPGAH